MSQNINLVSLSQLSDRQIKEICEIHQEAIPSLLGKLGNSFIKRYYQLAASSPDAISVCALDPAGRVLGWAVGSADPSALFSGMRTDLWWFIKGVTFATIRKPSLVIDFASQLLPNSANKMSARQIELTYIAVHPDSRSAGVGERLLATFLDHARVYGAQSCVLSVEVENITAERFYKKHGFSVLTTFQEGNYRRHRMFLLLDPQKALC